MRELLALLGFVAAVMGAVLALVMRGSDPTMPLDDAGAWLLCAAGLATLCVACWPGHDDALDGPRRPR